MEKIKKIVVIGPESTGKSSLCEALSKHYQTIWCREYAREYLIENGKDYSYHDLLSIAKGQIALEENCIKEVREIGGAKGQNLENSLLDNLSDFLSSRLLFIDTDMYVMKVWCEYVFNRCHNFILEEIASRKYDLYLLCDTDLPWVADELREYPDEHSRKELFEIYLDILVNQEVPFSIINGQDNMRIANAIKVLEELFIIH
ncbi:AAA family ATPase [Arachidicoccus soli]|uniref:AAA family ATPase n=1 Tax=Arachidicoccus soli TaxID=2341117 RepID=UPI001F097F6A|nr:ATP-binding protein [Arachidicoccus soli]